MSSLALFDLDHTLLPIDSDYEWSSFLARIGAIDGEHYQRENRRYYEAYVAGTLDIQEFLRFALAPLAAHPRAELDAWHQRFMREVIEPNLRPAARALVDEHRARGDMLVMVTATNRFVTAPIARAFGIGHLVATDIDETPDGRFTGAPRGTPSFREGKIACTEAYLEARGLSFADFDDSVFYSDSANDIPLLERVDHPVATNPDPRLEQHARERGWRILHLFR